MFWPRLQLTRNEAERWSVYNEPGKVQKGVLYSAYAGELNINSQTPEDAETIQISRRARILALTASGDVHNVEVQISDSSGEQYTMGYTPMTNLLTGMNMDPRGYDVFNAAAGTGTVKRLSLGMVFGGAFCLAPHVFEPNIVLLPNQSLSFKGRALNPTTPLPKYNPGNVNEVVRDGRAFLSFVLHVWEFPIE